MLAMQDAALGYADLGYAVFPCTSGLDPVPLTEHGYQDASTDLDQVAEWWHIWPTACIGVSAAGLLVVDIDHKDNPWLADQPERARQLAAAPTSVTPGGGRHHIFRRPPGKNWRCSAGELAKNVDIRTDGGLFIAPPSRRKDGDYAWIEGCELDCSPDKLPEPPTWLCDALDALEAPPAVAKGSLANEIPTGQRNTSLFRIAGSMRRFGLSQAEISAALGQVNADRCRPPLPRDEVERIAASVARYPPDAIATAMVEDHFSQLEIGQEEFEFEGLSAAELDAGNFELEYLIDGLLVKDQPGVIAGPKKSLKTNISLDLTLSLASGTPFLGRFPVARPVRAGLMSAESGKATLQETARRIALTKGLRLPDVLGSEFCFQVPTLKNFMHMKALRRFIQKHSLEVLILDPTYQMLAGVSDEASNMFVMGPLLKTLGDILGECNCTPILCHHFKKLTLDQYEPAELEHIAWAGFQEYVRQWLLINRRVKYNPDQGGHHELWFQVGGSAGHSGLWGLNIDEGTRQTPGGRYWELELMSANEAFDVRHQAVEQKSEARKQRAQERRVDKHRQAVIRVLEKCPAGETTRGIRDTSGIADKAIQKALNDLVAEGLVVSCMITKNKRDEPAFRLAK
jgi:Bifunctional DNA primase/polymerase, N-terminal/AAA domain/Primase C terminal 1 (PriCT-1)